MGHPVEQIAENEILHIVQPVALGATVEVDEGERAVCGNMYVAGMHILVTHPARQIARQQRRHEGNHILGQTRIVADIVGTIFDPLQQRREISNQTLRGLVRRVLGREVARDEMHLREFGADLLAHRHRRHVGELQPRRPGIQHRRPIPFRRAQDEMALAGVERDIGRNRNSPLPEEFQKREFAQNDLHRARSRTPHTQHHLLAAVAHDVHIVDAAIEQLHARRFLERIPACDFLRDVLRRISRVGNRLHAERHKFCPGCEFRRRGAQELFRALPRSA